MKIPVSVWLALVIGGSFSTRAHAGSQTPQVATTVRYSNIVHSAQSGDCDGFALQLWSWNEGSSGVNMTGLWTQDDGPCNDAAPIVDLVYIPATGAISFFTLNEGGLPGKFQGVVGSDAVVGQFWWSGESESGQGHPVRLEHSDGPPWKRDGEKGSR